MMDLKDNIYNSPLRRDEPKFKRWRSVGLILTYRCNCACEYCYYACDPSKGGLMAVDMAIDTWQALYEQVPHIRTFSGLGALPAHIRQVPLQL